MRQTAWQFGLKRKSQCSLIVAFVILVILRAAIWCQEIPGSFEVKTNFSSRLETDSKLDLRMSRPLLPTEGTIAILLNDVDVTGITLINGDSMVFTQSIFPMPVGENTLSVYLVSPNGGW